MAMHRLIVFVLVLNFQLILIKCNKCITTQESLGDNKGQSCIFPFVVSGKTYNECTKEESINLWCATSVMENGEVITDHWEDCKDSCFDIEESVKENEAQGLYSL